MKNKKLIFAGAVLLAIISSLTTGAQTKPIRLIKNRKVIVKGSVRDGDEMNYTFRAREGQRLIVKLIGRDTVFSLFGGAVYAEEFCHEEQFWSGALPYGDADDEYLIKVVSNYKLASYTLEVTLK